MRKLLPAVAALLGATALVAPASAAVQIDFIQGGAVSSLVGFTVIDDFNDASGISAGSNYVIQSGDNTNGAALPQADSAGTNYLSVKGDGFATIDFAGAGVSGFAFEWGSLDTYNTLEIVLSDGTILSIVPGLSPLDNPIPASGSHTDPSSNGVLQVAGTAGELFTKITLRATTNSFEIDNLAVQNAVPEASTWAMMLAGMGIVGFSMRRKRNVAVSFA